MRDFDDDELFSRANRDAVYPVLDQLRPAIEAEPVVAQHGAGLALAYRTGSGCALVVIRSCLVFRYGFPSITAIERHRLYKHGLKEVGLYVIGESSTLREAHVSWVGQPIPATDAWNARHYAIAFTGGLLECLGNYLAFETFPGEADPAAVVARHLQR